MTTEPETTLEPDNDDEGTDAIDPIEHEAVLMELGIADETIDATPEEIVALVARLAAEANTAEEGRMRALADFRNFQRRSIENEGRAKKEGLSGVVRSLLPALDHFDLALQSVGASATIEQVVTGVDMVRGEILRALESIRTHPHQVDRGRRGRGLERVAGWDEAGDERRRERRIRR